MIDVSPHQRLAKGGRDPNLPPTKLLLEAPTDALAHEGRCISIFPPQDRNEFTVRSAGWSLQSEASKHSSFVLAKREEN